MADPNVPKEPTAPRSQIIPAYTTLLRDPVDSTISQQLQISIATDVSGIPADLADETDGTILPILSVSVVTSIPEIPMNPTVPKDQDVSNQGLKSEHSKEANQPVPDIPKVPVKRKLLPRERTAHPKRQRTRNQGLKSHISLGAIKTQPLRSPPIYDCTFFPTCSLRFSTFEGLQQHHRQHTPDFDIYVCPKESCWATFKASEELELHWVVKHSTTYPGFDLDVEERRFGPVHDWLYWCGFCRSEQERDLRLSWLDDLEWHLKGHVEGTFHKSSGSNTTREMWLHLPPVKWFVSRVPV